MTDYESASSGGTDATDAARQQGRQVTGTAKDAASTVGDSAAARGRQITGQAQQHARSIAGGAQRQLRGHAQEETQRAGAALSTAGGQLRALADGRVDEAGVLGDYVGAAADAVNRWADTVQDRGFDGLLDDLRSFGRRRPGLFLASALAAGVAAGRFGRNAAQELRDDGGTIDLAGSSAQRTTGPSTGATGDDVTAWRTADGLVDAGGSSEPVDGGVGSTTEPIGGGVGSTTEPLGDSGTTQRSTAGPSDQTGDRPGDDVIVGYASDDRAVVVGPGGTTPDETGADRPIAPPSDADDVEHRPLDIDEERPR